MNRRDSVSVLAARIAARAVGRTLDDLNGIIFVRDVSYRYNDRELAADSVVIVGRNSLSDKFIRLRSDFVDADYGENLLQGGVRLPATAFPRLCPDA